MRKHSVCDVRIPPVLCMWSLASSNSLMCWLVMGLKEPHASKTSGTRREAIMVYPLTSLAKNLGGKQKEERFRFYIYIYYIYLKVRLFAEVCLICMNLNNQFIICWVIPKHQYDYSVAVWEATESIAILSPFIIWTPWAVRDSSENICGCILPESDTRGGE